MPMISKQISLNFHSMRPYKGIKCVRKQETVWGKMGQSRFQEEITLTFLASTAKIN